MTSRVVALAAILLVFLHGLAPQQATPRRYESMAECETQAEALRRTASSTTVYECVAG
jgi:hypothetical protein